MTDFCVRWGDDVQPYVMQLASEHIETLRLYCNDTIERILESRRGRNVAVIPVTPRVRRDMIKAKAFHSFEMLGFAFELRESMKKQPKTGKQEFVLNFAAPPDFLPKDMPPRLRRVAGKPICARPRRRRRPEAAVAQPAAAARPRNRKKRAVERLSYRFGQFCLWIHAKVAALATSSSLKLYKMDKLYRRLSAQIAAMWRRRPRLDFALSGEAFLTPERELDAHTPIRARLEPMLIGESLRLLLFTFVPRESPVDWNAYPFGRLADEGERIPA